MLGRPAPLWILAVLGTIGGLLCTLVVIQFANVVPWAGDEATYIGGRWTGVVFYALAAGFFFAAAYAWLTVKPWAHMVSILAAIIGFFVPFISHMDGTAPLSSAIAPILVSLPMLVMVFRPSTNRAMALALSGQVPGNSAKAPPPPKPMSAARKRELAEEQKTMKAPSKATAAQTVASASAPVMSAATNAAAAATATVSQAVAALPKAASGTIPKPAATAPVRPVFVGMAKSAAAMLGKSTPALASKPAAPRPVASAPAPTPSQPANHLRPRGFRADEV